MNSINKDTTRMDADRRRQLLRAGVVDAGLLIVGLIGGWLIVSGLSRVPSNVADSPLDVFEHLARAICTDWRATVGFLMACGCFVFSWRRLLRGQDVFALMRKQQRQTRET